MEPGDSYGALALQKPDFGRYRVLGWNRNAHVYVVWHEVTLNDLAFLLPGQRMEDRTQLRAALAENCLPPSFGYEYDVILAVPF